MERTVNVHLPKWTAILYGVLAIGLIPWIFDLAYNLPSRHVDTHWDALWTGFDVIMLITVGLTLWFIIKKTIWVVVSATALATLFLVDAWFDVLTSRPGKEQNVAIIFSLFEVSLSLLTYRLVYKVIHHSSPENINITTEKPKK